MKPSTNIEQVGASGEQEICFLICEHFVRQPTTYTPFTHFHNRLGKEYFSLHRTCVHASVCVFMGGIRCIMSYIYKCPVFVCWMVRVCCVRMELLTCIWMSDCGVCTFSFLSSCETYTRNIRQLPEFSTHSFFFFLAAHFLALSFFLSPCFFYSLFHSMWCTVAYILFPIIFPLFQNEMVIIIQR